MCVIRYRRYADEVAGQIQYVVPALRVVVKAVHQHNADRWAMPAAALLCSLPA